MAKRDSKGAVVLLQPVGVPKNNTTKIFFLVLALYSFLKIIHI